MPPSHPAVRDVTRALTEAARTAWRNADRCIGRLYWRSLLVRDRRHLQDPVDVAADLVTHLRVATNGGAIRPVATVLHPSVRVRNAQVVGYAGYAHGDGTVLGDPRNVAATTDALAVGWPGGRLRATGGRTPPSRFDPLPLIVDVAGGTAVRELAADEVHEVAVHHPDHPWFADLGLRWYSTPVLTDMALQVTPTVAYPVAFSGWYLGTEIASRDLADPDRYDALPAVAAGLGLDTSSRRSLWLDRADHELNRAVLHSYDAAGVRITDHHTESERFLAFVAAEARAGRRVHSDWSWVVPPQAAARLGVYHTYQHAPDAAVLPAFRRRDAVGGLPGSPDDAAAATRPVPPARTCPVPAPVSEPDPPVRRLDIPAHRAPS